MTEFIKIFKKVTRMISISIGGFTLISMMILIVTSIITRTFGKVLVGSYEITGLLLCVTAAFTISYVTLENGNVIIQVVIAKFPQRIQSILSKIMYIASFVIAAGMVWSLTIYATKYGFLEKTIALNIPYLPFQIIWGLGLVLMALIFLVNFYEEMKRR